MKAHDRQTPGAARRRLGHAWWIALACALLVPVPSHAFHDCTPPDPAWIGQDQCSPNHSNPILDDSGQPATGRVVPAESLAGVLAPLGAASEALHYSLGTRGPLSADAGVYDGGRVATNGMQGDAVPAGSCDLYDPEVIVYYDRDSATPWGYYGNTGASCRARIDITCYVELWRNRDDAFIDQETAYGDENDPCFAAADSGRRYRKRTKHYLKAFIALEIRTKSRFWGHGRGPRGWSCSGQGTSTLHCRKNSPSES